MAREEALLATTVFASVMALIVACAPAAQPTPTAAPKAAATQPAAAPTAAVAPTAAAAPTKPAAAATTPGAGGTPATKTGTPAAAGTGDVAAGKVAFDQNCGGCHPGGNQGNGPALRGRNLTADQITRQVRNGGGGMPAFPASRISDQQLNDIIAYVQSLR